MGFITCTIFQFFHHHLGPNTFWNFFHPHLKIPKYCFIMSKQSKIQFRIGKDPVATGLALDRSWNQILSGQISSRPHTTDFPKNGAFWKGNGTPAISGKSRLVKYYTPVI